MCYPICSSALSEVALSLGRQTEYDQAHGINSTLGYLFFSERDSCIPLFELMQLRENWEGVNKTALMNVLWRNFPEYAATYNLEERSGAHDSLGKLMNVLGAEVELSGSVKYVITMSPDAGIDFICW